MNFFVKNMNTINMNTIIIEIDDIVWIMNTIVNEIDDIETEDYP